MLDHLRDACGDHASTGYLTDAEASRLAECKRGGRRRMQKWTDEDRAKLARWYPFLSARECAYVLGRTYGSTRKMIAKMRLRHDAIKRALWLYALKDRQNCADYFTSVEPREDSGSGYGGG